ncbi:acyl CoA:acetate/3-ketoacid CoA transferase, alpha subunit [Desulfosporosinus orientis DSM 765]|uniref:Acyl CoA:acetate/3-ketoacid CoA transferase, alpha subunit n=1 Tax=Desulfosporosinus orientis (strain ATCC 19365 / DSM 765 / NCIMB 8382 / VKM B-1628 / Singapore I) TaxID=768706 RepID=G7WCW8_DESOD|nr:acyl CoA--acetate/3-ketoacid CoA transferase subunit alpha [Desulfosporosinus orientis]AET66874.1 acyl CoA:acetate/3-ketoacid CoA transferase, alpha subunit [Desulfosporosinus orientis DSM 765]
MNSQFAEMLSEEGNNKIIPLEQAVRHFIKPGMDLHFAFAHSRAHAVVMEIVRQFRQKPMKFTITATGILEYGIMLSWAGLVDKMVAGFIGDTYPSPAPNRFLQQAFKKREIAYECWTNLTATLGLLAGALNLPYIGTKSLLGSDLLKENPNSFRVMTDPFSGKETVVVRALNPDVAIVHGLVADAYGNTVIGPPFGENMWGAYAAKQGVIVTVEKIVSTSEIRKLSNYVKVPGHLVKSISVVPFGAHPQGMSVEGIPTLQDLGYSEDYETRRRFRAAASSAEALDVWMKEWVINTTHQSYLEKIGNSRLEKLRYAINSSKNASCDSDAAADVVEEEESATSSELLIINASRVIREKVSSGGFSTLLAGIGTAHLASWLAKYLDKDRLFQWELLTETGFYGYYPKLGDSYIFNYANIPTSKMQSHFLDILGCIVGSDDSRCLGLLGAAQVDQFGNINSTKIPEKNLFLTSGGGSNDVATTAGEVIIVITHSPKRMVSKVSFVTGNGDKVRTIVTDKGILQRSSVHETFKLTGCFVPKGKSLETAINEAKMECGWDLNVSDKVIVIPAPSREELKCLRALDPKSDIIK